MKTLFLAALALLGSAPTQAQLANKGEVSFSAAADGIFAAFRTHPLVGLGDDHGLAQAMDFYTQIVRDPRFAREVGNIVVEFGASGQQVVVDRHLNGETVPYRELRAVWTDTVGWIPTAGYLGFAKLLATVRSVNKSLPPRQRIKVWLGEPPVDWRVPTREQLTKAMTSRDSFPAELIARNILVENRKALVIYGAFHFARGPSLRGRVEADHPGSIFVIVPYGPAHHPKECEPLATGSIRASVAPLLATQANAVAADSDFRSCATVDSRNVGVIGNQLIVDADAVLFYGPLNKLSQSPFLPDYVLDADNRREIARRSRLGGPPLVRLPVGYRLRKADYDVDLDAPGFREIIEAMFAEHDNDGDGVVTSQEYVDPIP